MPVFGVRHLYAVFGFGCGNLSKLGQDFPTRPFVVPPLDHKRLYRDTAAGPPPKTLARPATAEGWARLSTHHCVLTPTSNVNEHSEGRLRGFLSGNSVAL